MAHHMTYANMGTPIGEVLRPKQPTPKPPTPKPREQQPPPVPNRGPSRSATINSNSSLDGPPLYDSLMPKLFMNGYMDKATGEVGSKVEMWTKMFVEVTPAGLQFCDAKDHKDPSKRVSLPLNDASVSLQEKRIIKLDCESGIRLFRPTSEMRAARWFYVLSSYCSVAPSAEGYCMKLSYRKRCLEERYLKLTPEGILSWYKNEDDCDPKGSIQICGEQISVDQDDLTTLFVHTKDRRYHFQFVDRDTTKMWFDVLAWHSKRPPRKNTSVSVRN